MLPLSFQDALLITLGLGISYLWVDSLCIIQDSEDDWTRESAQMGAIYKGGILMLAAAGAEDSSKGLFMRSRTPLTPLIIPYIIDGAKVDNVYFRLSRPKK